MKTLMDFECFGGGNATLLAQSLLSQHVSCTIIVITIQLKDYGSDGNDDHNFRL